MKRVEQVDGKGLYIVPFISRDFYATIADSFNIEQSDAIGLATNLTDDTYINYIQEKVFDEIYDDLAYSGTEYLNDTITYVGSEDLYPVDAQKTIVKFYDCFFAHLCI